MSIQRIELARPLNYQGLQNMVPDELNAFALELVRRLQTNSDQLMNDLRNQVVVDTTILPALDNGQAAVGTSQTAMTSDAEQAMLVGIMFNS